MKTKNWLIEKLSDGQTLTGAVLAELLDSYWHKAEMGHVAQGDAHPVSGDAVAQAITAMLQELQTAMNQAIAEALPALLQSALANYVTTEALNTALQNRPTQTWVQQQLSDKVSQQAVLDSLAEKVGVSALADKVTTAELTEALAGKVGTTDLNQALAGKADTTSVYTKTQIDAAMSARPTQTEAASETNTAINNAVGDLPNNAVIAALRTKLNDVISRVNTLSHVACGSETMDYCPMDMTALQAPTT